MVKIRASMLRNLGGGSMLVAVVTGQMGLRKKELVESLIGKAKDKGLQARAFHIGDMMYREDPKITPRKILDLDLPDLRRLRRSCLREIDRHIEDQRSKDSYTIVVNTHATFRWNRGLFEAAEVEELTKLKPTMFFCVIADCDVIKKQLSQDYPERSYRLKDILVWREEEMLATSLISKAMGTTAHFYIIPRPEAVELMFSLLFRPDLPKAYISFPISHVQHLPEVLEEIAGYKAVLKQHMIAFDPYLLKEKRLEGELYAALQNRDDFIKVDNELKLDIHEVQEILPDIDGQIISRDFMLIDQSDMVIAYFPVDPQGVPIISPGVVSELSYAYRTTTKTYVIWKSAQEPSPFIKDVAPNSIFASVEEFIKEVQPETDLAIS